MSNRDTFLVRSFPLRMHCAEHAIEDRLKEEVIRAGARRAFVICSRSISTRTRGIERVQAALGNLYAGYFDGIEVDSTYRSVAAATRAAREARADLLISLGGGSVIVATRVVNIYLCESGDPFEIMTQYPEGKPAYSPRLNAPKLPIINLITTPTTAMNRAGSGLANPDLDQRMEYFDPKTRPIAIIMDHEALMASPVELFRSTATTGFSGAVAGVAEPDLNPLVEGDREQILRLTRRSYLRLVEEPDSIEPRIDLSIASFLANRVADDGAAGGGRGQSAFAGDYAVSTALHIRYPEVLQGESTSVLTASVARRSQPPPLEAARRVALAMDAWQEGMTAAEATLAVADSIEALYGRVGMPTRVRDLGIPKEDFEALASETIKIFNANAGVRNADERYQMTLDLLEAAW